jgi:hypothetical protein
MRVRGFPLPDIAVALSAEYETQCHNYLLWHIPNLLSLPFVQAPIDVPHENKTETASEPMTRQIVDFVNDFYQADFHAFGYPYYDLAILH